MHGEAEVVLSHAPPGFRPPGLHSSPILTLSLAG